MNKYEVYVTRRERHIIIAKDPYDAIADLDISHPVSASSYNHDWTLLEENINVKEG